MADDLVLSDMASVRAHVVAEYHERRNHHDTPEAALSCLVGSCIELVLDYHAQGQPVPYQFLIVLGDVARWWSLAHDHKPLPGDLL